MLYVVLIDVMWLWHRLQDLWRMRKLGALVGQVESLAAGKGRRYGSAWRNVSLEFIWKRMVYWFSDTEKMTRGWMGKGIYTCTGCSECPVIILRK